MHEKKLRTPEPKAQEKLKRKEYERELKKLHIELVRLQEWVKREGLKVCVVFEGRDGTGVFALDGNVIAMEPESGGTMVAELSPPRNGQLEFRLLGAPPGDSGLKFQKKA